MTKIRPDFDLVRTNPDCNQHLIAWLSFGQLGVPDTSFSKQFFFKNLDSNSTPK
jgi:hypothetical protein